MPQPVIAKVHGGGVRGRLPARRRLRPRRRRGGDALRDPRREDRAVLLDADGAGVACGRTQARARAPAHREPIDAETAVELGADQPVVPADELDAEVERLVDAVARSSPLTVGIGKEAFYARSSSTSRGRTT